MRLWDNDSASSNSVSGLAILHRVFDSGPVVFGPWMPSELRSFPGLSGASHAHRQRECSEDSSNASDSIKRTCIAHFMLRTCWPGK